MKLRYSLWSLLAALLSVMTAPAPLRAQAASQTVLEDARVTGREILLFAQDGRQVMIVQGSFKLALGQRLISGQNAVVFIEDLPGEASLHRITVYAEGNARITEPDGASAMDRTMLIRVKQQGRVSAAGRPSRQAPEEFPIYERAVAALSGPAVEPGNMSAIRRPRAATRPATAPATRPSTQPAPAILSFTADDISTEQLAPKSMAYILKGNVYISQGSEESEQFMEMHAQSAVIFVESGKPPAKSRAAIVPQVPRVGGSSTKPSGEQAYATGTYLENDVVISQGERKISAPKAFYNFLTDEALVIQPVLKTVLATRNIPLYVRAKELRQLGGGVYQFRDAAISSSDFYTPSYSINASSVTLRDLTPRNEEGQQVGEQRLEATMKDIRYEIGGVALAYFPYANADVSQETLPLRRIAIGNNRRMGTGVQTEWDLFRVVGQPAPSGVKATLELDYFARGPFAGVDIDYARRTEKRQYSGYTQFYGMVDNKGEDTFGTDLKNIPAPELRGRWLTRHKEILPGDWELQAELAYISDKNFLEAFFRDEYFAGKDQETLLYAKKQRDNWAFDALLQARINDFLTQTESWPDLGGYLVGEPLAGGLLTFFNEDHLGVKRFDPSNAPGQPGFGLPRSDYMVRADTRNEIDAPLKAGPVNVTPYAMGRLSGWTDAPPDGDTSRALGQLGVKTNMHIWRIYEDARSRMWDVNRIKHIITPEVVLWAGGTSAQPQDLFPMDPGPNNFGGTGNSVEEIQGTSGSSFGIYQRWQTKRGQPGAEKTIDWMRLNVVASFFSNADNTLPADGRFFWYRPENSLARNAVDGEYTWNISDSTAVLSDINWDTNSGRVGRFDAGLAVQRDPRVRYYIGTRIIDDLQTSLGMFGVNYKMSKKYSISFFEQYDFRFNNGENMVTNITVTRKFARWYAALTFEVDKTGNGAGVYLSLWPEGAPEFKIATGRLSPLGSSSQN